MQLFRLNIYWYLLVLRTIVLAFIRRVGRGTVKGVKRMKEKFGLSEGEFTELQREIWEELEQKLAADEGSPNPHTAASTVLNSGETIWMKKLKKFV